MELEPRTTVPAHATGAVAFVPLAAIAGDETFRLRDAGDVSALAASIGRLGHLVPVELRPLPGALPGGPRFQVVAGFRRLAALRMLARERVLARIHASLDDEDARAIARAHALVGEPLRANELEELRQRLAAARIAPWAEELIEEALARGAEAAAPDDGAAAPDAAPAEDAASADDVPSVEDAAPAAGDDAAEPVEVTPDELAEDLAQRLYEVNEDLALAFDAWAEIPEEGRRMIVEQARYVAELYPLLLGGRR
jgi:ParB-like chromosome segregation protein Spo0J